MADEQEASQTNDFRSQLKQLLNKNSAEGASNTPDHVLADYLIRCLDNFTETTQARESWYGYAQKPTGSRKEVQPNDNTSTTSRMGSESS